MDIRGDEIGNGYAFKIRANAWRARFYSQP